MARYQAAVARTDALIEARQSPLGKTPAEIRARAELRLARLRAFLARLGDPHLAYPVIHVGGTSGKGSTATATAAMLCAAGYRTGLHTSPYLQAATEKLSIDGRLIAPENFADLVDEVVDAAERWTAPGEGRLTYGEIWVALMALAFARHRVAVAVVEVGAGGRFDLTNVVAPAVSVITSVGLDHTVTLGGTIPEIAWHKAGIIKARAPAITAVSEPAALAPLLAEADAVGTTLERVVPGVTFDLVASERERTLWRERRRDAPNLPAPPGRFQATNAALAVAAIRQLAMQGVAVSVDAMERGLTEARLPGRFETIPTRPGEPTVVLDGAHNPQKIAALVADLDTLLPRAGPERRILVFGVVEAKAHEEMVAAVAPGVDVVVATAPHIVGKPGLPASTLAQTFIGTGFAGPVMIEPDPVAAVERAMALAAGPQDSVLVTGSLYVVGHARERWYPASDIVWARTPWPPGAMGGES